MQSSNDDLWRTIIREIINKVYIIIRRTREEKSESVVGVCVVVVAYTSEVIQLQYSNNELCVSYYARPSDERVRRRGAGP